MLAWRSLAVNSPPPARLRCWRNSLATARTAWREGRRQRRTRNPDENGSLPAYCDRSGDLWPCSPGGQSHRWRKKQWRICSTTPWWNANTPPSTMSTTSCVTCATELTSLLPSWHWTRGTEMNMHKWELCKSWCITLGGGGGGNDGIYMNGSIYYHHTPHCNEGDHYEHDGSGEALHHKGGFIWMGTIYWTHAAQLKLDLTNVITFEWVGFMWNYDTAHAMA